MMILKKKKIERIPTLEELGLITKEKPKQKVEKYNYYDVEGFSFQDETVTAQIKEQLAEGWRVVTTEKLSDFTIMVIYER